MKKIALFLTASLTITVSTANTEFFSPVEEKEKSASLFHFSAGSALSAIDFNQYAGAPRYWGYNFRIRRHLTSAKEISLEYTRFPKHRLAPDWDNVKTWNADINLHYTFGIQNSASNFYALTGINYHYWKAKYSGTNVPEKQFKKIGDKNFYRTIRWGANFGTGFNIHLNEIRLFTEMRFTLAPSHLNTKLRIMDVVYSAGLAYEIPMLKKKKDDMHKRKSYRMPKAIYKWIKKKR